MVVLMNFEPTKQVILFKCSDFSQSQITYMLSKHCLIRPLLFLELKQKKGHLLQYTTKNGKILICKPLLL